MILMLETVKPLMDFICEIKKYIIKLWHLLLTYKLSLVCFNLCLPEIRKMHEITFGTKFMHNNHKNFTAKFTRKSNRKSKIHVAISNFQGFKKLPTCT